MKTYIVDLSSVDPKNFNTIEEFEKEEIEYIKIHVMTMKQLRPKRIEFKYEEGRYPMAICYLEEDFNYLKKDEHIWELSE